MMDLSKEVHLYTVLIQGISTVVTDQMPNFHVFRKIGFVLGSEFSTLYNVVS